MSQATAVGGLVTSAELGLRLLGVQFLRAGFGCVTLGREGFCGLVSLMGSLKCSIFTVFLICREGCYVAGTLRVL